MLSTSRRQVWHIFHTRKRTPFYVDLYTSELAYSRRNIFDFPYHAKLYHVNGRVAMRQAEWNLRNQQMQARLKREPNFLLKVMRQHYRTCHHLLDLARAVRKMPLARMRNQELGRVLLRYATASSEFWTPGLIPLYGEEYLTNLVQEFVTRKLPPSQAAEVVQTFLTPVKEGVVGEEYRSLLRVALLPHARQEVALKKHCQKYAWMANQLFTHTFYPLSYYCRRVVQLQKKHPQHLLRHYVHERRAHLRAYAKWMRTLKPDQRTRLAIETLNEAIFYRSWRGERPYESGFIVASLIEEIAMRLEVTPQDLLYGTAREIAQWLTHGGGQWKRVIAARKKGFVYLPVRGGKILTGQAVKKWERAIEKTPQGVRELKGKVAFPGAVRGLARIVHGVEDLPKVKRGDILVTVSTTPLYVPVLHKVAAIVTEEGGVLSHASVISREMKIPCVIGTKIATRVFKDGDRVEVDATKGVMRRI